MIEMILVLLVGFIIGWFVAVRLLEHVLLLWVHKRYLLGHPYSDFYGLLDHDINYELMKNQPNPPKSYTEFLRLHARMQPRADKEFEHITKEVIRFLLTWYPICLAVSVIFWANWHWYVIGFLLAQVAYGIYLVLVKKRDKGFYVTLLLLTILGKDNKLKKVN